jgi:hypothetical protein
MSVTTICRRHADHLYVGSICTPARSTDRCSAETTDEPRAKCAPIDRRACSASQRKDGVITGERQRGVGGWKGEVGSHRRAFRVNFLIDRSTGVIEWSSTPRTRRIDFTIALASRVDRESTNPIKKASSVAGHSAWACRLIVHSPTDGRHDVVCAQMNDERRAAMPVNDEEAASGCNEGLVRSSCASTVVGISRKSGGGEREHGISMSLVGGGRRVHVQRGVIDCGDERKAKVLCPGLSRFARSSCAIKRPWKSLARAYKDLNLYWKLSKRL